MKRFAYGHPESRPVARERASGGAYLLTLIADYFRILRSGVFMHSAYALRYLGARSRLPFALLHFLWRGERAGCRANPFVDPAWLEKSGVRLADCLRERGALSTPLGPDFDAGFYLAHLDRVVDENPLVHFWSKGFSAGSSPSPSFDLGFVKDVVAVFRQDTKEFLYELVTSERADYPRNEAELLARQQAFRASASFDVVRDQPSGRAFLVFIQAAHDHVHAFGNETRSFDVLVNSYDGQSATASADVLISQTGTKTTAIWALLKRAPEILLRYEAVLFLDDDIEMDAAEIDQLFVTFCRANLDLAQPALTSDSSCAYAALKRPQAGTGVRPISAVEIMMPVVSRRALAACGDAFGEAVSGWGVDALLSRAVRERFGNTVALIADVVAAHRRSIDLDGGALYRYLRAYGIYPEHEIGRIAHRFGISPLPDAVHLL